MGGSRGVGLGLGVGLAGLWEGYYEVIMGKLLDGYGYRYWQRKRQRKLKKQQHRQQQGHDLSWLTNIMFYLLYRTYSN